MQAAATALRLTASGVSQHLSRLESETGLALLDRSHRGGGRSVRLTSAGIALAERADGVAEALAEAAREIELLREGSSGVVRIGGFATALGQLLAPLLTQLAISAPALQPQIVEIFADEGVPMLQAGRLDLLIADRHTGVKHKGLVEHDLRHDPYRIITPAAWTAPATLKELLAGPWITFPPGEAAHHMLEELCSRHNTGTGMQHLCAESRTMLTLVAAGLGAAIVPELTLTQLPTPGISVYPTTEDIGSRTITLLSPARPSPSTQRLRALLLQNA